MGARKWLFTFVLSALLGFLQAAQSVDPLRRVLLSDDDGDSTEELIDQEDAVVSPFPCDGILWVDRALVSFVFDEALLKQGALIYGSSKLCYLCELKLLYNSSSADGPCINLWTPFPWYIQLQDRDHRIIASLPTVNLGYHGSYLINSTVSAPLVVAEIVAPDEHPNWPLQLWLIVFMCIAVAAFGLPLLLKRSGAQLLLTNLGVSSSSSGKKAGGLAINSGGAAGAGAGAGAGDGIGEPLLLASDVKEPLLLGSITDAELGASSVSGGGAGGGNDRGGDGKAKGKTTFTGKRPRVDCLDTFRGLCLACMIFVNYGGGHYWYTEHSAWNGLTVADLLFPWFMWVMGCSMALSTCSLHKDRTTPMSTHLLRVCRRAAILFGLGLFLGNGFEVTKSNHHWRVPGVLQYFGISYLLVSLTVLAVKERTSALLPAEGYVGYGGGAGADAAAAAGGGGGVGGGGGSGRDGGDGDELCSFTNCCIFPSQHLFSPYRYEWLIQGSLFLLYTLLCLYAPTGLGSQCPAGYNGPGGLSDEGQFWSCTGGLHRFIDEQLVGLHRMYHSPTCKYLYECGPYDPESLFGSLSATFLTFLGLMTGRVLLHFRGAWERCLRWWFWGLVLCLVGGMLCGFSQNQGPVPINKNLWSSSFVLVMAGAGMLALSLTYLAVDHFKAWTGAPFRYLGLNSILIYCAHGVFDSYFPFSYYISPQHMSHATYLTMNIVGVACWMAVAFYCYRIKFFVKV